MHIVCQRCQKAKATVHVTDSFPHKRELHLCEECAAEEGIIRKAEDEPLLEQQHQTTNAILQEFLKHKSKVSRLDQVACPHCGLTYREFRQKGLLGCPHDYTVFNEVLLPLLEQAHEGASVHIGKAPPRTDTATRRRLSLMRLRRALQEAIDAEDYEVAAQVRDQISELEAV